MDEHGEKFNKELAQTEEPNRAEDTITKIKSTLEGIKSRLDNNVEQISNPEDGVVEVTQPEQKKRGGLKMKKVFFIIEIIYFIYM